MESTKNHFRHYFPIVERENTTQPCLCYSWKFPIRTQEKHCPLAPPWSHITAEPPTPFPPSRRPPELPEGSELLTSALLRAQTKTRERKKTQTWCEWGSSKYKLMRRNLHTVHLQSGTLTLYSPPLAPTKDLLFVIHQSHLCAKLLKVLSPTPYSSPCSWKLPVAESSQQHTRDATFPPGIQPVKKVEGTTTR